MKSNLKLPPWAAVAALSLVVAVVAFIGWRTFSPNDPALDGHQSKVFTPADIAKFRSQDQSRQQAAR